MAETVTKSVWFSVKRLDLNENDPSAVISLDVKEDDKVSDVTQALRLKLHLNNTDLILRCRNIRGSIIPLNGKITQIPNINTRPLILEVVKHFQSVQPKPNSLELTQYAESLKNKLLDIQERITKVEASMENMQEKRKEKVSQEISKLENTVSFLKKRIEEAETIEWRGMFVKNPLW
ncbi:uncharacterized protein LOC131940053 isoform X2 [Physella acuta]|uniref:uncharacterized protein LOC131940053 isoform X2 n=1 Tax=Physella acuta TaxID=109671 RepID=UPI0027DD9987|nr:uncharacterized protein LOC131940053 isoform X2 [Physella acuta]